MGRCAPAAPRLPAEDLGRARAVLAGAALAGGTLTAARSYDGASRAVTPLG